MVIGQRGRVPRGMAPIVLAAGLWLAAEPVFGDTPGPPPRNACREAPGHVTCFRDRNGLIHGAVVRADGFTVACRAFRLELFNIEIRAMLPKPDVVSEMELVVAGACEQTDAAGRRVRTWSTASGLGLKRISAAHYASASAPLPAVSDGAPPAALDDEGALQAEAQGKPISLLLHYFPAKGTGAPRDLWNAGAGDVENALFAAPVRCDPGFVVCSAYLKMRHPDPKTRVVSVDMIGAHRHRILRNDRPLTVPIRRAEFFHESFSR